LEEFEKIGFRISILRHLFNLKAGVNFKDFEFSKRVLGKPPLKTGPTKDVTIDLDLMVEEYLDEVGFDKESTTPGANLLEELNIEVLLTCFPKPFIS